MRRSSLYNGLLANSAFDCGVNNRRLSQVPPERFRTAILDWLALCQTSPRLIAAAGDQVPPGAGENRIDLMRELVETHGRYRIRP